MSHAVPFANLFYLDPNPTGNPAVLLLHGLGANSSSWQLQIQCLVDAGLRPIAPDVPGFGQSSYTGKSWSIRWVAEVCSGLLSRLQVSPVYCVGLSMGGTLAQQLALDYPDQVSKLVLACTFACLRPDSLNGWLYFARRFIKVSTKGLKAQAPLVAERIFPGPDQDILRQMLIDQILQADERTYRSAMRSLGFFDSRKRLKDIKIPALVITGEKDNTVPVLNQSILARMIPGAHQVIIPNAGHAVTIDQPDEFNRVLLAFFNS
jgi:3-oxoadipate enol-lactonase